jgi:hypothetical protein
LHEILFIINPNSQTNHFSDHMQSLPQLSRHRSPSATACCVDPCAAANLQRPGRLQQQCAEADRAGSQLVPPVNSPRSDVLNAALRLLGGSCGRREGGGWRRGVEEGKEKKQRFELETVKLGARRVALGGHIKGQEVRHLRDHRLARHVQRTDLRGAALRQKQTANRCKARGHVADVMPWLRCRQRVR